MVAKRTHEQDNQTLNELQDAWNRLEWAYLNAVEAKNEILMADSALKGKKYAEICKDFESIDDGCFFLQRIAWDLAKMIYDSAGVEPPDCMAKFRELQPRLFKGMAEDLAPRKGTQ